MKEWWTLLHPPYTMLHLSFVAIGACLVGPVNAVYLWVTLAAFFLDRAARRATLQPPTTTRRSKAGRPQVMAQRG